MDWNYYLGRKYDLLQQNANADTTRANAGMLSAQAGANFDNVRARLLPGSTAADIGLTNAQALLAKANANNVDETTKYVGPLAKSSIALNGAQIGNLGAEAGYTGARTTSLNQLNRLSIGDQFRFGTLGNY